MKLLILGLLFSMSAMATEVDMQKSKFIWEGVKVTGKHNGTVKLKSAKIKMADGKVKSAELVMDMSSIFVSDLKDEWKTKFEKHIKSSDFFNVGKFPTASLIVIGDSGKSLNTKLTILGKTNDVEVKYEKIKGQYMGTLKFDRTKFGLKYGSGKFFKGLGDKMITDEIKVKFVLVTK